MEYKWKSIEKDGYPYTKEEFEQAFKENPYNDLNRDYLLTDGEDYFIGFWRPEAKAWDNCNMGWVRKYLDAESGDESLAQITHYMELPPLPQPSASEVINKAENEKSIPKAVDTSFYDNILNDMQDYFKGLFK